MARVLVVDDDTSILRLLRLCLEDAGHEVVATDRPEQALDLIRETQPAAIVLDVMMPEVTGWDILALIRGDSEVNQVPVLVLSALGDVEHRVRGIRAGADDYLGKPFDPEELVARLEGIMARKPAPFSGLKGSFKTHPFPELIQGLAVVGKSGRLEIATRAGQARLDLVGGGLVRARYGSLKGSEAFLALAEGEEGSFSFTTEEGPPKRAYDWEDPRGIQALLLQAAWVEDELREMESFLPELEQLLVAEESEPSIPAAAADLPILRILDRIRMAPVSLQRLLEENLSSKNQVRLCVAWLNREKAVSVSGDGVSRDEETFGLTEDLDFAIRELFQQAVFRGFSLESVRIIFLVASDAWNRLAPLLLSLPKDLLGEDGNRLRRQIFLGQKGELKLYHATGTLALELASLETTEEGVLPAEPKAAGVLLWAEEKIERRWITAAETLAGPATSLVLVAGSKAARAANGLEVETEAWRKLSSVPQTLGPVLHALSEA